MTFIKYYVFNHTKKAFETLTTSAILKVGEFVKLPQGELQIFKLLYEY